MVLFKKGYKMVEIIKTLTSPYKRYIFTKKVIDKTFKRDIFTRYELNNYKEQQFNKKIQKIIDINNLNIEGYDLSIVNHIQNLYLSHRFDILGSGWVYASDTSKKSKYIFSDEKNQNNYNPKLTEDYNPIDWNKDLKTGYEFSINSIYKAGQVFGLPENVDVKICWDLARMHHLVLLSIFSLLTKEKMNVLEFKNQVIDFSINNPIGYGINWCGSMEASIRASNLLIAYDIFKQVDDENVLDDKFDKYFYSIIYQHGRFIIDNLEIDLLYGKNHNHYLSNIVGLLYISVYLNDKSSRKWWLFAKKEFFREIEKQFMEDGCNFEGSTSYHRFSGEMFVYGLAIIKRFDGDIPEAIIEKLYKAAYFSKIIKKRCGKVIQIGDNDSGRFLKFTIQGELISTKEAEEKYYNLKEYTKQYSDEYYFDEDFLNHDTFIACVTGLIDLPELIDEKSKYPLEYSIIKSIANSNPIRKKQICTEKKCIYKQLNYNRFSNIVKNKIIFNESCNLINGGRWLIFEEFGLCCYKSDTIDFYIFAGRKNKTEISSHIHNDKLHFEFCINGNEFFSDPGTGVYTSDIECREMFRSRRFHNVPDYGFNIDKEKSVFCMEEKSNCEIIALDENSISLFMYTDTIQHVRKVTINEKSIIIEDYGTQKFEVNLEEAEYFSSGYGKLENKKRNSFKLNIVKTKKEKNI